MSREEVEMRIFSVYFIGHGKIARRRTFTVEEEALEAAKSPE